MNNINKPLRWRGRKPKAETIRRAVGAREAVKKVERQIYGTRRLFFRGLLPVKPV